STPAKAARRTMSAMIAAPKRTSPFRPTGRLTTSTSAPASGADMDSAIADPRVHVGVDEIDEQVRHHEKPADEEDRPLHQRIVALGHPQHSRRPRPGDSRPGRRPP